MTTFIDSEKAARCRTSLNTGDESEYFDQVVAISQEMINKAMEKLYDNNEALQEFRLVKTKQGSLVGELDPPRILISNRDDAYNQVYWQIIFKDGLLKIRTSQSDREVSVKGWVITVRVPLAVESYHPDPTDGPETVARKKQMCEELSQLFTYSGNYSPQRLYAKFASAAWSDFRLENSTIFVGGKDLRDVTINQETAKEFKSALREALISFAEKRQEEGLTTIGTKFVRNEENDKKQEKNPARFPPIKMVHQTFPYRLSHGKAEFTEYPDGEEGLADPGSRNCLLYCEICDRGEKERKHAMPTKMLSREGIFTTIGDGVSKDRIDGTFAISHQLFFEVFLLKNLQQFVFETQICPGKPAFKDTGYATSVDFTYTIGGNTDKTKQDYKSDVYAFKRITENGRDLYQAYVDVQHNSTPPYKNQEIQSGWYTTYRSSGSPSVKVTWKQGHNLITVKGECQYIVDIRSGKSNVVDPSQNLMSSSYFSRDTYDIDWTFDIEVFVKDGELALKPIVKPEFLTVTGKTEAIGLVSAEADQTENIRKRILECMEKQIKHLEDEVFSKGFNSQNKFIYAGTGQFDFSDVIFNDRGDVLATIVYTDFSSDELKEIPDDEEVDDAPDTGAETLPGTHTSEPPAFEPLLTWAVTTPVTASPEEKKQPKPRKRPVKLASAHPPTENTTAPASAEKGKPEEQPIQQEPKEEEKDRRVSITVTGTNNSDKPVTMEGIDILTVTSKYGTELFRPSTYKLAPEGGLNDLQLSVSCHPEGAVKLGQPTITMKNETVGILFFEGESGALSIPPEASIIVTAKGISGRSTTTCDIDVTEHQVRESVEEEKRVKLKLVVQLV